MPGKYTSAASQLELKRLLELSASIGKDPLLTQASTGNSSLKLDGVLWIKASGKWMADALRDDILIPLRLKDVAECLHRGLDPAERFPSASLETAMHAALLHRVVVHAHSVTTIAWAVRRDAPIRLQARLEGLRWQWIPYTASGLPLSRAMEHATSTCPDANLFILGNHGLVISGNNVKQVEDLLIEVQRRLEIRPRSVPRPDYSALAEICADSTWTIPDDNGVHALSTDLISQRILAGGLLYPCQAIFSGSMTSEIFRPIPWRDRGDARYRSRPFLILERLGVVINRSARPAEIAMISGLAHVIRRLSASAPVRYLTQADVAGLSGQVTYRYRELANVSQSGGRSSHSALEAPRQILPNSTLM